jgi:hypothetical protein
LLILFGCGSAALGKLNDDGWQLASPADGASYSSFKDGAPYRIDHAFFSEHFTVIDARYVTESGGQGFIGAGSKALSDHAILSIDVELKAIRTPSQSPGCPLDSGPSQPTLCE